MPVQSRFGKLKLPNVRYQYDKWTLMSSFRLSCQLFVNNGQLQGFWIMVLQAAGAEDRANEGVAQSHAQW